MDLSRITIKPRVRNPYESIDLGFIMARTWWKPLFLSWFIPSAIVYLLLSLIFYDSNWLALFITWWLKPLWDRGPLYIASRKLFDDDVNFKDVVKTLAKLYSTDIFAWLLWRRFSFTRSFDMPVTVLESLKHSQRRKRLDTLHQYSSSSASWLTIVCVHLEMIMTLGVVGFIIMLIPNEVDVNFMSMIVDEDAVAKLITNMVTFISMALIAPFYTMAGFALYINRRVKLEAWDIEIRFRHLAKLHSLKSNLITLCFVFVSAFSLLTLPGDVYANSSNSLTPEKSTIIINEVLKEEEFHKQVKTKGWRLKTVDEGESNEEIPQWIIAIIKFLEYLFSDGDSNEEEKDYTIANILEMLLWLAIILIVGYVIYRILKYLEVITPAKEKVQSTSLVTPDIMFGLNVREDSIPADVVKQTMHLWETGKNRDAIGLLYRSTLSLLIHKYLFEFFHGYTEQECSNIVQRSDNQVLREFVGKITTTWQQVAYAHSIPLDQHIKSLCNQWTEVSKSEK